MKRNLEEGEGSKSDDSEENHGDVVHSKITLKVEDENDNNEVSSHHREGRWTDFSTPNEIFLKYYQLQNILTPEEIPTFLNVIKLTLPLTFRFTETLPKSAKDYLQSSLHNILQELTVEVSNLKQDSLESNSKIISSNENNNNTTIASPLAFLPEGAIGWYVPIAKTALKKTPSYSKLRDFVQIYHDSGYITRQEAVSMLPPLVLDVQSHHRVLDMCASPGSKTSQLLELLFSNQKTKGSSDLLPIGFVLANDIDQKRSYNLIHNMQRLSHLQAALAVCNHDAQKFPSLQQQQQQQQQEGREEEQQQQRSFFSSTSKMYFDRILCDVMCSGDGTMRKSPDMWMKWTPAIGYGLHRQQVNVLARAVQMLNPDGGRIVYSTCSMNPIEDEAVIAEVLRKHNHTDLGPISKAAASGEKGNIEESDFTLELVNCEKELNGTLSKCRKGLSHWVLTDKTNAEKLTLEDPNIYPSYIMKSMIPPTLEEAKWMHLEYCVRILPQDLDSGGFFMAVLQKKKNPPSNRNKNVIVQFDLQKIPITPQKEQPSSFNNNNNNIKEQQQQRSSIGNNENPQNYNNRMLQQHPFLPVQESLMDEILNFYGIHGLSKSEQFLFRPALQEPDKREGRHNKHQKKRKPSELEEEQQQQQVSISSSSEIHQPPLPKRIFCCTKALFHLVLLNKSSLKVVVAGTRMFDYIGKMLKSDIAMDAFKTSNVTDRTCNIGNSSSSSTSTSTSTSGGDGSISNADSISGLVQFRFVQESVGLLSRLMYPPDKRRIVILTTVSIFKEFLNKNVLFFGKKAENEGLNTIKDEMTLKQLQDMSQGSCIVSSKDFPWILVCSMRKKEILVKYVGKEEITVFNHAIANFIQK